MLAGRGAMLFLRCTSTTEHCQFVKRAVFTRVLFFWRTAHETPIRGPDSERDMAAPKSFKSQPHVPTRRIL